MTRHEWQVWIESENENSEIVFTIVFEGSYVACKKYYKSNGGSKAGLHMGYDI